MKVCSSLFCQKYHYLGILDGTVIKYANLFFFFFILETQFLYHYFIASKIFFPVYGKTNALEHLSSVINKG